MVGISPIQRHDNEVGEETLLLPPYVQIRARLAQTARYGGVETRLMTPCKNLLIRSTIRHVCKGQNPASRMPALRSRVGPETA